MANNLDWLGQAVARRVPARLGQALHDPVHARQGLRPAAPRARAVVHRVQLHDAPGARLRDALPGAGRRAPDGRRGPVGQHHGRPGAHPADVGGERRREPGPRDRLQAAAVAVGHEVRQERGRRVGVARPGADVALRVLPVLAQHGRPRRRARTCAGSRCSSATRSRRSTPRSPPARGARGPATAGVRRDRAGPRRGGRARGRAPGSRRRSQDLAALSIGRPRGDARPACPHFVVGREELGTALGDRDRRRARTRRRARRAGRCRAAAST